MKMNEGTIDRVIRIVLGVVLLYVGFFVLAGTTLGIVLDVLGAVALATGISGFCLLYKLFGNFSTKK